MELSEAPVMEVVKLGFKRTEVGVFPEDWTLKPLESLADVRGRVGWKGYTKEDLRSDGPKTIGAKHIDKNNKLDLSAPTYLSVEKFIESPEIAVRKGDVLIVQRGTIGSVVMIDREIGDATINPSMLILRSLRIDATYLYYQLISATGQNQIMLDTSSTGVPMITQKQVGGFLIPLPTKDEEQRAIATALSDVDALLGSLDALIAKKKAIKQGAMQQLLTGKQRLPGFKGEWEVKRLGEIARIGMGRTPSRLNASFWGAGYAWISIGDLHEKVICNTKEEITERAAQDMNAIPKGTLIMSFKLSIGRMAFTGRDMYSNEAICSFGDLKADPNFLYYILGRTDFSLYGKQAVKGFTLNKESLNSVEVTLPPMPEQTAIATVLSDMDAELEALAARRAKTALLKQGMMQELLTGRTRLI